MKRVERTVGLSTSRGIDTPRPRVS